MSKTTLKLFSENIRRERQKRGLSQEELASRAGVHRTYIGMIERAEKNVTLETIEKLARALDVPLYQLLKLKYVQ